MAKRSEITKVRLIIRHFLWQTREVVTDAKASQEWLARFRRTLEFQELEESPDAYALALLAEARSFNDLQRRKGQMLGARKQLAKEGVEDPTQEQLDEKWLEMYGNDFTQDAPHGDAGEDLSTAGNRDTLETPTSCDLNSVRPSPAGGVTASTGLPAASSEAGKITADGDTREDSQDMHHARKGGTSESATSANLYALDGLAGKDRQPRAPGTHAKSRGARAPEIPGQEDLYGQVAAEGLDEFDARQWYDMCSDRRWLDRDGNPIANWKGALKRFCDAKARKRGKEKG